MLYRIRFDRYVGGIFKRTGYNSNATLALDLYSERRP